jgi:hypothetical protein
MSGTSGSSNYEHSICTGFNGNKSNYERWSDINSSGDDRRNGSPGTAVGASAEA